MNHRFARILSGVFTAMLTGAPAVQACSVCFGPDESTLVDGTRAGVWVMLGIILAVQVAFAAFFLYLRKRVKVNQTRELDAEWLAMQQATR